MLLTTNVRFYTMDSRYTGMFRLWNRAFATNGILHACWRYKWSREVEITHDPFSGESKYILHLDELKCAVGDAISI